MGAAAWLVPGGSQQPAEDLGVACFPGPAPWRDGWSLSL